MTGLSILGGGIPAIATAGSHIATGKGPMAALMDAFGWGSKENNLSGVPGLGIKDGQQTMVSPELQGRNDPSQQMGGMADIWQGNDMDLAGSIGEQPGMYADGGKVTKPNPQSLFGNIDPPGPDDQLAGVKTGERILNEEQYASLSKEAKAEVDAALKKTAKRK